MASWRLRFGSYDLPEGFTPVSITGGEDIAPSPLPRMAGAATQTGRVRERQIVLQGGWSASSLDNWETTRSAILNACRGTGDLWIGRDDRYYKDAQLVDWSQGTPADGRLWAQLGTLQLVFLAAKHPILFDAATNTPSLSNTGGTVNYDSAKGDADTYPTWTITVNAGGTGVITLANSTTGETCTIQKPGGNFSSSDVIVLCGLPHAQVATLNGVSTPGLFKRRIPRLQPGNNTITLSDSGSLTITSLACSYPGRWR